jgi:hypothetical protein
MFRPKEDGVKCDAIVSLCVCVNALTSQARQYKGHEQIEN